jgi:hypothetical protein
MAYDPRSKSSMLVWHSAFITQILLIGWPVLSGNLKAQRRVRNHHKSQKHYTEFVVVSGRIPKPF